AVAERDGHAERHPQITHSEPKGEAAESPHYAPEVAPEERGTGSFAEHRGKVAGGAPPQRERSDDPAEKAADQPVGLPRPALDAAVGNIEAAGSEAAQPMKDHAQQGIRSHIVKSE